MLEDKASWERQKNAVLNKFWKQYPTKQQLNGQLQFILQTIKIKRGRYADHCWKSKDELKSDLSYELLFVGQPCTDSWGCRIHRPTASLQRGKPPPMSVLDMTLNNLMVRLQWCRGFGEYSAPLHCHCSQVHSGSEW